MRKILNAIKDDLQDQGKLIRNNFNILEETLDKAITTRFEGQFLDLEFTAAVTNQRVSHGLGITPKDILETSRFTPGSATPATVTYLFETFDSNYIYITTSGAVKIRFFLGRVIQNRI